MEARSVDRRALAAQSPSRPPLRVLAVTVAAVLGGLALLLGATAAAQPLPKANTYPDLYYPFFLAPFAVALATVGAVVVARRPGSRWGRLCTLLGVAWSVNAVLVAARGLAATPAGAWVPQVPVAWAEDWFYLGNDFGTIIFLVLLYPTGTARGAWRYVAGGLAAVIGLMALAAMIAQAPLDGTGGIANPLGIAGTHWMYQAVGEIGYPAVLLGGALAMIVRAVVLAVRGSRRTAAYMGAMIAFLVAAHVWMFSNASDTDPRAWIGWLGFVPLLAAASITGAAGILRAPVEGGNA